MVDPEAIAARVDRLGALLVELERIRADGEREYQEDVRTRLAAEHALQLAIQICIDIGAHLVGELGLKPPPDYRSVFESLRSAGLDDGLAGDLARSAGLRNVIVHGYLEVDHRMVWQALGRLDDLRTFAAWATSLAS